MAERRKDEYVQIRVDATTKRRWKRKAGKVSLSEWLRRLANEASKR